MKIQGTWPVHTFHKGRKYMATPATNQPGYKERGLFFLEKRNGQCLLASVADGEIKIVWNMMLGLPFEQFSNIVIVLALLGLGVGILLIRDDHKERKLKEQRRQVGGYHLAWLWFWFSLLSYF